MVKGFKALVLCVALSALLLSACSNDGSQAEPSASDGGGTLKFSIGASSPGGGFYMGASAISTVVNSKLDGYEASVEVTGASANNAALVQAGEIQLGMCATEVAWEAYNGKYDFEGRTCDKLRSVMPGWGGVYMFITTADKNINSVYDFEGKSYSGGPVGSSNEIITKRVFDLFGVKANLMNLPNSDASRSLGDGNIDGFSLAHPASAVSELEATKELKIITIGPEDEDRFREAYPQYVWLDIPAGYYKALPDGAHSAGLYNMVVSSSDQGEDFIYNIVKSCYENRDLIKNVFSSFSEEMDLKNVNYSTIPYHAGAVKYFREQGVSLDEDLIPPEAK